MRATFLRFRLRCTENPTKLPNLGASAGFCGVKLSNIATDATKGIPQGIVGDRRRVIP
jgi:hypothetical protein